MSELVEIDVVIPAYNAERFLAQAVHSVWASGYPHLNLYIVDDGSTDGTLAMARSLAAKSKCPCQVLQHPGGTNRGVSASRNLAIEAGTSPWIAFLDADDEYRSNRFKRFLECQKSGEVDAIDALCEAAEIVNEDGDNGTFPKAEGFLFSLDSELIGGETSVLSSLLSGRAWPTSAIILRRSLLSTTGLFDDKRHIAEDCHLWLRIACLGRVLVSVDGGAISIYRRHTSNTYRYGLASRLALLDAMVDVAKWSNWANVASENCNLMRRGSAAYALRACIVAREEGRPDYARRVIMIMVKARRFDFLVMPGVARQIGSLLLGRSPRVRVQGSET